MITKIGEWLVNRWSSFSFFITFYLLLQGITKAKQSINQPDTLNDIEAIQAISREIALDKLLFSLMSLAIAQTGAERGYLLLIDNEGSLTLETAVSPEYPQPQVLRSYPLSRAADQNLLCHKIVHHVARTQENVIFDSSNPSQSTLFRTDYIQQKQPLSILCMPLSNQEDMIGVLYLENTNHMNVFTSKQVDRLTLLCTQAAISISHARIIAAYQEREQQLIKHNKRLEKLSIFTAELNASILDLEDLLVRVVNQVKETFNYYHAHIFLLKENDNLVVVEGTGEAGAKMKASGHSIPLSAQRSLVARAVRTGKHIIVNDVQSDESWLPNPLLPYTYAEMVIPIIWKGQALGAIDVQQNTPMAEKDIYLLTMLSNQVAVAIYNAQQAQEVAAARDTAEKANQVKSIFLSRTSHELRTPLNGILGHVQTLKRDETLNEHHLESLAVIEENGAQLLTIINNILDFSSIGTQYFTLSFQEFALAPFLAEIIENARQQCQQKEIAFIYEGPASSLGIRADARRLRQILLSLLDNAIKFTEKKGVINFRVMAQMDETAEDGNFHFEIEDSGRGLSATQLKEIFQPFGQLENPLHAHAGIGIGLGLNISQQLVQAMGGEIQVKSELGQGSTFWFDLTIPIVSKAKEVNFASTNQLIGYKGRKRRILVADDKSANRGLVTMLLSSLGFVVEEARDGQKAITVAMATYPDLIFMDLVMPKMTGIEAIQRLKQLPQLANTQIVAMSSSTLTDEDQQKTIIGCDAFLTKPFKIQSLLDILEKLLSLEWVYSHTSTQQGEDIIQPPPIEELIVLSELVQTGNVFKIRSQAQHIASIGDEFKPFANQLQKLARQYKMNEIKEFIQQWR